ncbi:hypothetical protein WJX73_002738 [Symbiochloris irregularis]|uniref:Uncharacterized protein n=1 Tax=Symbiochloris irregularis TaxID=706552 RepID=A0AAW1P3T5_9CHLO
MREKASAQRCIGKKRKATEDLDAERTLHHSFVSAANSISHLFTQAVQQHKKAHTAGARQALERQLDWVLSEYGSSATIPTQVLLQVLQSELLNVDRLEEQYSAAWPAQAADTPHLEAQPLSGADANVCVNMVSEQPSARLGRYQSPGKPPSSAFCSWRQHL